MTLRDRPLGVVTITLQVRRGFTGIKISIPFDWHDTLERVMKLDDKVCYCFHVTKRKVVNYIRLYRPKRASQISECGGAGTGCGWCIPYLKQYFEQFQRGETPGDDEVSPEQYALGRAAHIKSGHGKPPPGATPIPDEPASESTPPNTG